MTSLLPQKRSEIVLKVNLLKSPIKLKEPLTQQKCLPQISDGQALHGALSVLPLPYQGRKGRHTLDTHRPPQEVPLVQNEPQTQNALLQTVLVDDGLVLNQSLLFLYL